MYKFYNNKIKAEMTSILPGEFYASSKSEIIYTILGSCISVALFDSKLKIGGMNHFMLPGSEKNNGIFYKNQSGRYGINAMELLINSMLKLGAMKSRFTAKVFGGSNVLQVKDKEVTNIAKKNIEFVLKFLKLEKIPVLSFDTGGLKTRRIIFFTGTGKIYQQKLNKENNIDFINMQIGDFNKTQNNNSTPFK
jgi:chemotaxis protein CheD